MMNDPAQDQPGEPGDAPAAAVPLPAHVVTQDAQPVESDEQGQPIAEHLSAPVVTLTEDGVCAIEGEPILAGATALLADYGVVCEEHAHQQKVLS